MTTVVVPIFNAPDETQACLTALAQCTSKHPVILIDDASDHPDMAAVLETVPDRWTVVHNQRNIGFVATANLGMTLSSPDDVVLLNADTEVTPGWLESLERCLHSDPAIASVSPLTNHGEIASIPQFCVSNPFPDDPSLWAEACRASRPVEQSISWVDVPTTIGFCMLIRRQALEAVGYFDEAAFGRGYGEENDWCQRTRQSGWRHVLCDEAFVAHRGGASFGPLGLSPGGTAMETLKARYPQYEADVQAFITADPMARRRQQIIEYYDQTQHNRSL